MAAARISSADLLRRMKAHVLADPLGDLPLWWRIRLWRHLDERYGSAPAQRRRSLLSLMAGRGMVDLWHKVDERELTAACQPWDISREEQKRYLEGPAQCFEWARQHLLEDLSAAHLRRHSRRYCDAAQDVDGLYDSLGAAVFAYSGTMAVVDRALASDDLFYQYHSDGWWRDCWTERCEKMTDHNVLSYGCDVLDPFFFGGCLAVGRPAYMDDALPPESVERRRAYWIEWLQCSAPWLWAPLGSLKRAAAIDRPYSPPAISAPPTSESPAPRKKK